MASIEKRIEAAERAIESDPDLKNWRLDHSRLSAAENARLDEFLRRDAESGLQGFTDEEMEECRRLLLTIRVSEGDGAQ